MRLTRRQFLKRAALLTAAGWAAPAMNPLMRQAWARTLATAINPDGTTLLSTIVPTGDGTYVSLTEGPGWPIVTRTELAAAQAGREDRRTPLASIVHLTDVHIIDAQSPARVEFLDRYADEPTTFIPFASAFRAQEVLTPHVAEAMVRKINSIERGPVTGRGFDCAVSTGDNVDNQQENETDWFFTVLDGGPLTPDSGAPGVYEGVQVRDPNLAVPVDPHYWHPEEADPNVDHYRRDHGFPHVPGFFAAALAPFSATGLDVPWFSTYGNHDGLLQGNAPENPAFEAIATGPLKVISPPAGASGSDFGSFGDALTAVAGTAAAARPVTPDAKRRFLSPREWVERHLAPSSGPGPVGHGYTADHAESGQLYFSFPISDRVLGISLDTVNRGGYADGSIGKAQLDWLEAQLTAHADQYVVLFSHHGLPNLTNPVPDPALPTDQRMLAAAVEAAIHRHPNVIAWVNGHSHVNRVYPRPRPGGGGFWEINTAAHVDHPQHARIVEVVDNHDGTLSIFATLVDHAGPAATADQPTGVLELASLSRELAVNEFQEPADRVGQPGDRNVELLLPTP